MRPKSLALLLLALGCGLVASIGITEVLSRRGAESAAISGETQAIFVAMTDIGLGDTLTAQVLKLEQWPKDKVPAGAITKIEDVEGRRARTKIFADEPILENRVLGKGASEQGATALIPKGYRVVPVQVDLVSGGSSLILPGDRVDVMVHFVRDPSRDIQETVTRTILQDVKVFAVNDVVDLEKDKEGGGRTIAAKTISLLVTPEQGAKIMLASKLGSVNLVMRGPDDDKQANNAQARPAELFGLTPKTNREKETLLEQDDKPEAADKDKGSNIVSFLNAIKAKQPAPAPPVAAEPTPQETWTMRVLKPGEVSEVQFETSNAKNSDPSASGVWKTTTPGRHEAPPAKKEPPAAAPPAPEEPPTPDTPPASDKTPETNPVAD